MRVRREKGIPQDGEGTEFALTTIEHFSKTCLT